MRLASIRREGGEGAAVVVSGGLIPVPKLGRASGRRYPESLDALLAQGLLGELRAALESLTPQDRQKLAVPFERVEYAPLYRRPPKIWGIGLNYVEHAGDLGERAPAEEPASFMKPYTTIIGPGEAIRLPEQSERVTAEAELGVVIGRECRNVAEEEALEYVAGFTCVLDMTAEDILQRNPRYLTRSKSFDTFFSFGPHLVTPDEVESLGDLEVATVINGRVHRRNAVANMTFSPRALISFHSRGMTLLPGDIISTGTPGAAVIREGDVAGCEISGFEPLVNPVERQEVL
ncbi:FAA hydrolase family protein [Rubrobacter taiwanensis]|uniref:FAA hydrolase family protein n=1 Tax=Rubrobacter taiwanensis TaxID=185139 RepID=A0A4R1BPQ6_9ACTN|nr:fumarylacetoacetate hydrolase family protein [Rubrobacter taiwanensis]TCJ19478.1 FAA hydrolase family protein [Rubrobacter taiwanensis]